MRTKIFGGFVCLVAAAFVGLPAFAADDEEPKFKTKQIMKVAFKGSKENPPLLKQVASGKGTAEDAKKLHGMLVALSKNKPKKGDAESWAKFTGALVKASQGVIDGDADAAKALSKAANCKACHSAHKPS